MTVLDVIQRSSAFLAQKGVESPRLQAECILAHTLRLPRMKLYLDFERRLQAGELDHCRELVRRRGSREPLQYILGTASFCGIEMALSPDVLIPRPETELLAERGWEFLKAIAAERGEVSALDLGTGSGCIATALALKCPAARVSAVEISPRALGLAAANAARHQARVEFLAGDGFRAVPTGRTFDLIVSNPPYIPTRELEALEPEVREHEPRVALDGGADGLDYYRRFAVEAGPFLKPWGKLMLEFGDGQSEGIRSLFEAQNWVVERVLADYSQRLRILIAQPPSARIVDISNHGQLAH